MLSRSVVLSAAALAAIGIAPFVSIARGDDAGKPAILFNGKDLTGWKVKSGKAKWVVGEAEMDAKANNKLKIEPGGGQLINPPSGQDIFTEGKFGDGVFEVDFMVPKGSNSGIYLMGEYEVQILDSYGRKNVGPGDLGGLYGAAAPKLNASKKPGEWQKFVIDFRAPRFEDKKKVSNAKFVKITLNGQVIHENVEMKGPTPGGLTGREAPTGPLMFQGDHGPVTFCNIRFTPK